MRIRRTGIALVAGLALVTAACGGGGEEDSAEAAEGNEQGADDGSDADDAGGDDAAPAGLEELIAAAQEEGSITFYGAPDERVLRAMAEDFQGKYGVTVEPVRLVTSDLTQRFAAEAEAGAPVADVVISTHSPFFDDALANGWLESISDAGLPDFPGTFPEADLENGGATAPASLVPTELVYNTDAFPEAPDSWEVYGEPEMAGEIQMAHPDSSPANISFWSLIHQEYGEELLQAIAANEPAWHNSAVPATQAVAAGEGSLAHPGVRAIVRTLQAEGAPVEVAALGPTTGPEMALGLAAGSESPNAAKLFAHYVMSEEGNELMAEVSEAASPYGLNQPEGWVRPGDVEQLSADELNALLGAS